jgi:nucleoid DNA-binding protein
LAISVGIDPRDARVFIENLAAHIIKYLAEGTPVHIDSLGTLSPMEMKGITRQATPTTLTSWKGKKKRVVVGRVFKVSFKKARLLKETMK